MSCCNDIIYGCMHVIIHILKNVPVTWGEYFQGHVHRFDKGWAVRKKFWTGFNRGLSNNLVFKDSRR